MSDANTGPDAAQTDETNPAEVDVTESDPAPAVSDTEPVDDGQTYPAEVVRKLRDENAKARTRVRDAEARADELAARLHVELARADGRLADPTDLAFDAGHLDDAATLAAAIDALIDAKPHLQARKPSGSVGQGERGNQAEPFSLLGKLKSVI